mgnify:CR=1 FL=1
MALLTGFPPSNLISPSVRIAEKDLSYIAPVQTGHRAGLVGFASKGPINVPTLVTSVRQLHTQFGYPHPDVGDPYLLYAAEQYLTSGQELFVVRCGANAPSDDEAATTASVDVPPAGTQVEIVGNVDVSSGITTTRDQYFRYRLNGVLSEKILVLLAGTYTDDELIDALNEDNALTDVDGIEFDLDGNFVVVRSTFAYGPSASIELVSTLNPLYGPTVTDAASNTLTPALGMGTGMTQAVSTGTVTFAGTVDLSTITDPELVVVIDGTDNVLIDNVAQTFTLASSYGSMAAMVTALNTVVAAGTVPGGMVFSASSNKLRVSTLHSGADAKVLVKSSSSAAATLGFAGTTASGTYGTPAVTGGSTSAAGLVTGGTATTGDVCFTIEADSPGIDGNDTQVVITNNVREGSFTIDVYNNGSQVESWAPLVKDESSRFYVESFLTLVSDWIRVTDDTTVPALPASGTYTLTGGTDGIPSDPDAQDELLIGNSVAMTGLQALSDPEQIDIDLIAIPGHTSTSIVLALLDFCQVKRQDCFSIVSAPFGLTVKEVVAWQNGVHPLNGTRFDNDFGALYWPWVKVRDSFNRVDVWCPPEGVVMAAYARSDSLAAPWFAPAGTTRGLVGGVTDVFSRPTLDERDLMYGNRNCVNPIIQFADLDGFFIWGQKTLQRLPTALDRVNVRRMMLYVEKKIKNDVRSLLFEPNDERTRSTFVSIAERTLGDVRARRGITDFIVQCDEELNTPDVIDQNELRARIGIIPTRAVEFIFIEFSIHRTGSFAESDSF